MVTRDEEIGNVLSLTRRAMVASGGKIAALGGLFAGLGLLEADAKKRKRRRRKNKKHKKPQGAFVVVAPEMTGAKEAPIPDSGDDNGTGSTTCRIKGNEICCDFTFDTSTPNSEISGIHIHKGAPNVDGPIVVPFEDTTQLTNNCVIADEGVAAQIKTKPEDFYSNIHTDAFPDGAVRDQFQATS